MTTTPVPVMPRDSADRGARRQLHLRHGPWSVIVLPVPAAWITPTTS